MAGSREAVLGALRAASPAPVPRPPTGRRPAAPEDPVAALRQAVEAAGGALESVCDGDLAGALARLEGFAAAARVWSAHPGLESRGLPDGPEAVEALEFAVLPGLLAVAECGAVWNEPSPADRRAALLADHLVLAVPEDAVVPTLHEAYARIRPAAEPFGWLLAGPSKTADIEQSLVLGAHGPRALSLLLIGGPTR